MNPSAPPSSSFYSEIEIPIATAVSVSTSEETISQFHTNYESLPQNTRFQEEQVDPYQRKQQQCDQPYYPSDVMDHMAQSNKVYPVNHVEASSYSPESSLPQQAMERGGNGMIILSPDSKSNSQYHRSRRCIRCMNCPLLPTTLCCVVPYPCTAACFCNPLNPFACCFSIPFIFTWFENCLKVMTTPNPPTYELIISDGGLQGWDLETNSEVIIGWSQIMSLKLKFYKVTKNTSCFKCTNTEKIRDEARANGTYKVGRGRKRAYNLDIFNGAGGDIYSDENLTYTCGFGCLLPCYLLHIANIPSQDFNSLEICGVWNGNNKFKFCLHAIKVKSLHRDMGSSGMDQNNINILLIEDNISSTTATEQFADILERKRLMFMQR